MRHVAKRLLPYVGKNKVIHSDDVQDPALKRLITDRRINHLIRNALKQHDPDIELLVPRQVDDEEMQLKRYIQYKLGTTINLSELRDNYKKYYLKLYKYGSPKEVLERWGFKVTYNYVTTLEELRENLQEYVKEYGGVEDLFNNDERLYRLLFYHAKKNDVPMDEFLQSLLEGEK